MGNVKKLTPKTMEKKFEEYKHHCETRTVLKTDFSAKLGQHITTEIPAPVSCDIKGFFGYMGMTPQAFYATYDKDPNFDSVIARIKLACENSKREGFEQGRIPSQLAGLWMSNYGYSTKVDSNITGAAPVVIVDDLKPDEE
jgi:hypothetical protein